MDANTPWRIRDFHPDDLDAAVRLWDNPAASSEAPVFGLSDLIAAVRSSEPAVVAVVGEELVGTAVATVSGGRAWVMRISLATAWRRRGIGSAMLGELERRLVAAGVHRIQCLLAGESDLGALALEHAGYTARPGVVFYERLEPVHPGSAGMRQPRTVSAAQGVTNEMLRLIPPFREQDERLLICATNSVRALDSAFLRHGRFDYVSPVGPPDPAAREAFERVLFEHGKEEVTTADVLQGIAETRRTLTAELVAD